MVGGRPIRAGKMGPRVAYSFRIAYTRVSLLVPEAAEDARLGLSRWITS